MNEREALLADDPYATLIPLVEPQVIDRSMGFAACLLWECGGLIQGFCIGWWLFA
jgi:hypothetical protein